MNSTTLTTARKLIRRGRKTLPLIALAAAALAAAALAAGALAPAPAADPAAAPAETLSVTAPPTPAALPPTAAEAQHSLATIPVAPPVDVDYDPAIYGPRWADLTHSGCDTRNRILTRDMTEIQYKPGTRDCVVTSGVFYDRYNGATVAFERKSQGYQPVQIDHVYPRALAAAHGALELTDQQRLQFANDPLNLVTTTENQVKGDSGPSEWMPERADLRCAYAIRFIAVTAKYSLSLSPADHDALAGALAGCSAEVGD